MDYAKLIKTPPRSHMNSGLSPALMRTYLEIFGAPRNRSTNDCAPITNPKLSRLIVTADVGPFRVTGLKPAVQSLTAIFTKVQKDNPSLYAAVRTAGMTCCRHVRGFPGTWSNHAFGGAVDLYFGDSIDQMGDGRTQIGLKLLYPYFHNAGWFWAAGYRTREDSMHFELADETIWKWYRAGKFK